MFLPVTPFVVVPCSDHGKFPVQSNTSDVIKYDLHSETIHKNGSTHETQNTQNLNHQTV